jgi:hypothetical protein
MKMQFILITFISLVGGDHNIIGHWISKGPKNSSVYLDFNRDKL